MDLIICYGEQKILDKDENITFKKLTKICTISKLIDDVKSAHWFQ